MMIMLCLLFTSAFYLFFVFNLRCVILFFNCNFLFGDYFEENSD